MRSLNLGSGTTLFILNPYYSLRFRLRSTHSESPSQEFISPNRHSELSTLPSLTKDLFRLMKEEGCNGSPFHSNFVNRYFLFPSLLPFLLQSCTGPMS